jgi:hypothetical protein
VEYNAMSWKHDLARVSLRLGLALFSVAGAAACASTTSVYENRAGTSVLTADAAQARSEKFQRRARALQRTGATYKNPQLREAEDQAARYAALAAQLRSPTPPPSEEVRWCEHLLATYRGMGGAAYKAGLVQKAEEALRRARRESATGTTLDNAELATPRRPPAGAF